MKKSNLIFFIILAVIFFYIGNRMGETYHTSTADAIERIDIVSNSFGNYFSDIHISTKLNDIMWGLMAAAAFGLVIVYNIFTRHNFMYGVEHGSASWGTPADIAKYIDKNPDNNMLFTRTERMSLNTRQTLRNNNVVVVGGSGSGKTRFVGKPNLMQLHSSYVVTDPKGSLIGECGKLFADNGYIIKTINLIDFSQSMHYNPFRYIRNEKDILQLADMIIKNLGDKSEKQDFWVKAEKLLYQALIAFIWYELPPEEQNFSSLLTLLNKMSVREDDDGFVDEVDALFLMLEEKKPEHYAVLQYKKYKQAAGKTAKSILISCGARLAPFDVKEVRELTKYDEMELETIGDKKTILFIITDDTNGTYNFLGSMLYSQLFNTLCNRADTKYKKSGSRLPVHVRCILDEFANIGQIPEFEKLIATIRSREISATIIVQNLAQIEAIYQKQADTIVGNCDTLLFLGSGEEKTLKAMSERVGKTTVDHRSGSTRKGQQGDFTVSEQILGRELITPDEVGRLDNSECLLFIRGVKPFKSKKYRIEEHKRYKYLSDSDPRNYFDIKEYNAKLKAEEDNIDLAFKELQFDEIEHDYTHA